MLSERLAALRRAVAASPDDDNLRLVLAEALVEAGEVAASLTEYQTLLGRSAIPSELVVGVGLLALDNGRLDIAKGCAALGRATGSGADLVDLEARISDLLTERGLVKVTADGSDVPGDATLSTAESITFADVGGMDEVKAVIHRMVILPLTRADMLRRYGRKSGGGVLLYGPPGCGKTMMARATAGECAMPFINVRIEDIVDPYLGVSERNLHAAFEAARSMAPSVVFVDELDALAYARNRQRGSASRQLVHVLLQELDAIGSDNTGVLVLAATNAPWDVDEAMLRPGRFDRTILVPPPDAAARQAIVELIAGRIEHTALDSHRVAAETELYSGADLQRLVDQATDALIDTALRTGEERPLDTEAIMEMLRRVRPTTLDWLQRADAYVEFANASERYDEVAAYLKRPEVRKRRRSG